VSTKNNPGKWDCYAKAAPDEEMFVLLASDEFAPALVREWASRRFRGPADLEKIQEALRVADAMERWRAANPPEERP
jgi:hypothetical protein